jgi:hypothetical protein
MERLRSALPWTCPACQNAIRLAAAEPMPRRGITYRCHICRLELVIDLEATRMTLAPMPDDDEDGDGGAPAFATDAVRAIADDRPRKRPAPSARRNGAAPGRRATTRKPTTHFEQIPVAVAKKRSKLLLSSAEQPATWPPQRAGDSSTQP